MLIEQVEQAQKLQTEAEKEADAAMTQLEEFINEQEKLVGTKFSLKLSSAYYVWTLSKIL